MQNSARGLLVATALLLGGFACGMYRQQEWALALWPWPADDPLGNIFTAAVAAAVAASLLWVGASGHLAAFFHGQRMDRREDVPTPAPVRWAFAGIIALLVPVGVALTQGVAHVLPWPQEPSAQAVCGWLCLGTAVYLSCGFLLPQWQDACGQLVGLLAHDLVLAGPYLERLASATAEDRPSLTMHLAIMAGSALLAVYYLVLHPTTRLGVRTGAGRAQAPRVTPERQYPDSVPNSFRSRTSGL